MRELVLLASEKITGTIKCCQIRNQLLMKNWQTSPWCNHFTIYNLKMSCIHLFCFIPCLRLFWSIPLIHIFIEATQNPFSNIAVTHGRIDEVKSLFIYSITTQWFQNQICHRTKWMGHFVKAWNNVTLLYLLMDPFRFLTRRARRRWRWQW